MSKLVRLGVLADTHAQSLSEIPPSFVEYLSSLDGIIHVGDYGSLRLLEDLKSLGNFHGVAGNHDAKIDTRLPRQHVLSVNGLRIGLVHGHGCWMPFGLARGLRRRFETDCVDAIVYGHTHLAVNRTDSRGVLFFNPGSALARFPAPQSSFGVLTIGRSISADIHYLGGTPSPVRANPPLITNSAV